MQRGAYRTTLLHYGFAVAAVATAIVIRRWLDPFVGDQFPYATMFFAVVATAWFGGRGPAFAAAILGALAADWFLIPPRGSLLTDRPDQWAGLALFAATGVAIALLGGAMHAARAAAEARANVERDEHAVERAALLREQEDVLSLFVEHAPAAIAMFDRSMRYLLASRRWISDYGLEGRAMLGHSHYEIFPEIPERWKEIHRRALAGAVEQSEDDEFVRADGSVQHLRWEVRPWYTASSEVGGIIVFSEDITRRRQVELSLDEARALADRGLAQLRAVVGNLTEGLIVADAAGNLLDWNLAALRMHDFQHLGDVRRNVAAFAGSIEICTPDGAPLPVSEWPIPRLMRGERLTDLELLVRRLDTGLTLTVSYNGVRVPDPVGDDDLLVLTLRDLTAQRHAEEEHRHAADLFQAVAEQLTDQLFVKDVEGRFLMVNPVMAAMLGRPVAEIIGKRSEDLMDAEVARRATDRDREVIASGDVLAAEEVVLRGGEVRTYAATKAPLRSRNGEIIGVIGLSHDITEVRRAADAQRASEERLRLLVESVRDYAIYMLDPDGRILTWNAAAERMFGWTAGEVIGQSFERFFPSEDRAANLPAEELRLAAALGHAEREGWRVRHDGSRFWASGVVAPLPHDGAGPGGFSKVVRDLTERRRSEDLLRSVVDAALDAIISIDERGMVQSFNHTAEQMFGYAAAEVVGRNVRMLMPPPYLDEHDGYLEAYLRTGEAKIIGKGREVEGRRADGTTFPMELAVTEFELDGRRHFTGMVRDLTQRRRLEDQLRLSQKMEAVGQLAGGIAHDFNNLLTVIMGCSEMMMMTLPPTSMDREFVTDIRDAAIRAASLTRQLLAFSRRQILEPREVSLNDTVAETEKMLKRLIGEDITLTSVPGPGLSMVKVDPGQLEQVVLNLSVNARDAMPRGGHLTVETRNVEWDEEYCSRNPDCRPGRYVMLSMTDTGEGMTPEVKARIFEPFFTTKGPGKGTGLGLATVFGIVRQSEGLINVYSEPGVGTSFRIYFPAIEAGRRVAATGGASMPPVPRGTETILLVEDDEQVRKVARLALEGQGYTVLEARGGAEALAIVTRGGRAVDLVVTDVVMPEMSGRQLVESLRRTNRGFKLLYVSGYTDDAVVRHGIIQEREAFLQKPFTPTSLTRKVREVLDSVA